MDTLASAIVLDAFREGNYVAVGHDPTAPEIAEGMARLNTYIASLFGTYVGTKLHDWYVPNKQDPVSPIRVLTPDGSDRTGATLWRYPPANSRVLANLTGDQTIYFPANPSDGARMGYADVGVQGAVELHGNGRLIESAPSINAPLVPTEWFYRADRGEWIRINKALTLEDPVPFPVEFDDLLITGLAIRLAARYGVQEVDAAIVGRNQDVLRQLKIRYSQGELVPASDQRSVPRPFMGEGVEL